MHPRLSLRQLGRPVRRTKNTTARPVIAIVETNEEIADLLAVIAEEVDGRAVITFVPDLQRGQPEPEHYLREHNPRVVIWDIAPPYGENWDFFQRVCQSEAGQGRTYVLTTANPHALEQLTGPTPAHEVMGKPFDIERLIATVRRAMISEAEERES